MTPISELISELANARDLPAAAVMQCQLRIEEAAPHLRAALERAADGKELSEADENLFFRGLHILGASRDAQSFPLLLRLLRRPPDEADHLLGDATTLTLPRLVVGVFDGDADALFAAIADRGIDELVRAGLLGAAAFLTWEGRIERQQTIRFIERFDDERLADDDDFTWVGWQEAIALLGLRSHASRSERAWQDGRISDAMLEFKDFLEDLARAERAPGDVGRFADANLGYLEDLVAALALFTVRRDDEEHAEDEAYGESDPGLLAEVLAGNKPVINPWRHVGRNDPCPCGSGKKAKKCCLAA